MSTQRYNDTSTDPEVPAAPTGGAEPRLWRRRSFWVMVVLATIVAAISEAIGEVDIKVGHSQINLLPIIWAVLIGTAISLQKWRRVPVQTQRLAGILIAPIIAVFMARLGLLIGPSLSSLGDSSAALLLQEVGHFLGTVVIALPIAVVLLGMGRTAIGATYSIDREPMLGIVAERCGGDSPEYNGALGTYVVGSVLGAVTVAVIASVLGSLGVFSPIALAIGSAVGSTSMMLGALGSLTALFPDQKDQIFAYAGVANAVTGLTGTYAAAFIALPLTKRLYPFWTKVAERLGRTGTAIEPLPETGTFTRTTAEKSQRLSLTAVGSVLAIFGVVMLIIQVVHAHKLDGDMVAGMIVLLAISYAAIVVSNSVSWLPYIVVTMIISTAISAPFSPVADNLAHMLTNIDLVALGTPVLAVVGLSLGREAKMLIHSGWRMFVAAICVVGICFIAATAVADFSIHFFSL